MNEPVVLLREASWVVAGRVVSFLAMLAMVRLLTHELEPAAYGELALGLTICNLLSQTIMGALGQGVGRYYSHSLANGGYTDFGVATARLLKHAGLLIFALAGVSVWLLHRFQEGQYFYLGIILFASSYVLGLNDIANGLHNLKRNRKTAAFNASFELALRLPLVALFINLFGARTEPVILAYLVAGLCLLYLQWRKLEGLKPAKPEASLERIEWYGSVLRISFPAALWGSFVWLQQASDRWALQIFATTAEVGIYSMGYQIGYAPVMMGVGILSTVFTPIIYMRNPATGRIVWKLVVFILCATTAGAVIVGLWGELLLSVLVAEQYRTFAKYLPLMVVAAGLYASGDALVIRMMSDINIKALSVIKILSSLCGISGNILGAYFWGLQGLVWAQSAFGLIYFILCMTVYLVPRSEKRRKYE